MEDLQITERVRIPASDLRVSFSRSGGPGGQHVNTTDTRVRLHFNLSGNQSLHPMAKDRIRQGEPNRITTDGQLVLTSDQYRSRARNLDDVRQRLIDIVQRYLTPPKRRKATKPSRGAQKRRLEAKKRRSSVKSNRRKPTHND